ncbi:MAG TPA: class II aldolase [Anaerolineaceae bacterium]|nr:class II aldolase [Anaerolineaceae bacterium]HBA91025.1 class II aldolase [Anaerolineaceae bacterium]
MSFPRDLKESVWSFARQMLTDGIAHHAQGNISLRQASSGLIAVTPSAIPYDRLQVDDIVVVDLDGQVVEGKWRPTSELPLHLAFYRAWADIGAVVHSHAPYATLFGVIGEPLPMLLSEAAACLGGPVPVAPYCRPGSEELADSAVRIAERGFAVILANHGLVTVGPDLGAAYDATLAVETTARVAWMARAMGVTVNALDPAEVAAMRAAYIISYHPEKRAN